MSVYMEVEIDYQAQTVITQLINSRGTRDVCVGTPHWTENIHRPNISNKNTVY